MECARICVWDWDCNRTSLHREKAQALTSYSLLCPQSCWQCFISHRSHCSPSHQILHAPSCMAFPPLARRQPSDSSLLSAGARLDESSLQLSFNIFLVVSWYFLYEYYDLYLQDCHLEQAFP